MKSAGIRCVPLVQQLIERVLPVGARFAPEDLPGRVVHRGTVRTHRLAVRFHRQLLQVGGEAHQIVAVGQHRAGLRPPEEAGVPDPPQHAEQDRRVRLERGRSRNACPSRGIPRAAPRTGPCRSRPSPTTRSPTPHRIPAADPVPEPEHVLRSIPNSTTRSSCVDTATKCLATASSPSAATSQRRAAVAFVRVSSVENVLDATTNRVRAGSKPCRLLVRSAGSMLDTNRASTPAST